MKKFKQIILLPLLSLSCVSPSLSEHIQSAKTNYASSVQNPENKLEFMAQDINHYINNPNLARSSSILLRKDFIYFYNLQRIDEIDDKEFRGVPANPQERALIKELELELDFLGNYKPAITEQEWLDAFAKYKSGAP
jgi:hypothetical protein